MQKAYAELIKLLGVIRSAGITPEGTSFDAQKMWQRMADSTQGTKMEYVGYYRSRVVGTDTGYAYVMRNSPEIKQDNGGIDLTPAVMNVQTQNAGGKSGSAWIPPRFGGCKTCRVSYR